MKKLLLLLLFIPLLSLAQPTDVNYTSKHLNNPFQTTVIKLLGDSQTAGVGGTGYSVTGPTIYGPYKQNVLTATCWANMFYDYVNAKYNKDHVVSFVHPDVANTASGMVYSIQGTGNVELLNTTAGTGFTFTFYGDHFDIGYISLGLSGILNVYVDGVLNSTIDAYSATYNANQLHSVTELTADTHTVNIFQTNTKNALSSGKLVYLKWFRIPKSATVINFGISGTNSQDVYFNRANLIKSTDDIVILQIGTNDRNFTGLNALKSNIAKIKAYCDGMGIKLIVMSANPTTVTDEGTRVHKMADVDNAIQETTEQLGIGYISNNQYFLDYCRNEAVSIVTVLKDSLHMNDFGQKLEYENIMKQLKLARLVDGLNY